VVCFKLKKGGRPRLWFRSNQKKEVDHGCGLLQIEKRRSTTVVVSSKLKKGGRPRLWFCSNQKKEADHGCGLLQIKKRRSTSVEV